MTMMYQRDNIINDLKQSVCEVTFTKVSGENRVMRCTLDQRYIPTKIDINHLDQEHSRKENKDIVVAWDVHNSGWRSFRVDSIQYMQEINGY